MKRSVAVALFAGAMMVVGVCAQEKAAAEPAAPAVQPAAPAVQRAAPAVQPAAPAVQPAAPAGDDLRQQTSDVPKQVSALEREARKNDPTLSAKLDDLEKQRRQIYIQAKPELEALYAQQDMIQDKGKAAKGRNAAQGGKARQGGAGEARAEKRAERATQKAAKEAQKTEHK